MYTSRGFLAAIAAILVFPAFSAAQTPAPQADNGNKTAVIKFVGDVNPPTISALLQAVDSQYKIGIRKFVILISSNGGDVLSGFMAYSYLKGMPIEVTTFNVGNVDSAAGILFCAGTKRYAVPDSRFLIHEVSMAGVANGQFSIDLPSLEAQVSMLKSQEQTIAKILATTVGKPQAEAEERIHAQKSVSAEEAKQWGLVQDIRTQLFDPADSILVSSSVPVPPPPSATPEIPGLMQFTYSSASH
jgi:ATP-dependent protease ClpP protease subunit